MKPSAKVIADSISERGDRVTTMEVVMHRFVLAEFNTHRAFSRNSASSRAIPLAKQIERINTDPALPVSWPAEQKGMQGGEPLDESDTRTAKSHWWGAAADAINRAQRLGRLDVHKSVVNRLLEPFMWHTVVVTATDWAGFWEQRLSPLAQPEIRVAAEAMKAAYDASDPVTLLSGQWHLPYLHDDELHLLESEPAQDRLVKVSATRCARVSYLTQDGVRDIDEDLALFDRLVDNGHWSPLEHVCRPDSSNRLEVFIPCDTGKYGIMRPRYGNLLGWHQLRFDYLASTYQGE